MKAMKKNLKRVISALLVLVMMVSLLPANVFAAEETKNATISVESVSAAPGATVDVQISIKGNPGILGARLSVAFDDGLTLVGASNGDAFSVLTMTKPGKLVSPCQFVWDGQDITNEDIKDGVILTLTFAVAPDAVSGVTQNIHISYKYGDFVDANLKKLVIDMVDGGVAVADYVPGDTNKDQEVTPADIIMLRRYLAGGYDLDINVAAGDVNADEELTPVDVILIRRYLAGGYDIELLPSPLAGVKPCEHTLQAVAYKAPTETEAGNIAYWRCTSCGKLFSDAEGKNRITLEDTVIPATGQVGENEYRINYILNPTGDEYLASVSIANPNPSKYSSAARLRLKEPSVPGYTFEGWYDGSGKNAAQVKVLEAGITEEIDLYARWSKIEYKVFYDNSSVENENSGDKPFDTYTVDTGLLLPKPSIDRYVFLGWTDDSDTIISRIPSGTTGNITLHANWTSKRNLAVPVKKLDDPIIVEDTDEGKIMFAYEIGEIQNVPLYLLQELVSAGGIVSVHHKTVTSSISTTDAKTISQAINEATTDSTAWTLGSDWNTTTSLDETVLNEHGYTKETGVSLGKTSSNTFTLSTSEYDDTVVNTVDGSTATTTEYDTTTKKGRTSWESKADLSVSDKSSSKYTSSVEAGVSAGLSYGPASVKAEMSAKQSAELSHESSSGASVGTTITHENQEESKTGTDKVTVDQNTTATTTNKGWKKNSESSSTSTTSFSQSQKEALSQRIAEEKHYGESYSSGGSKSDSAAWSTTTGKEEQYTATVTYSEERTTTETAEYTIKGEVDGSYRLVLAGIAHVFAVVTYDIATTEYSVATYSVMDDHTYQYIDYSANSSPKFDDNENGVLSFEVPYFVSDFVNGRVISTEGLVFDTETGKVVQYSGDNTTVIVPEYISKDNKDGTQSAVTIRHLAASAFGGNTLVENVMLSNYIREIPDGAFKNCTSLMGITASEISSIGAEAFAGCTSLDTFKVSKTVTSIGERAFSGVDSIEVTAANLDVVQAALNSGAKNIKVNFASIADELEGATLHVPQTVETVELQGGQKSIKNLRIESEAQTTILNGITITDCTRIPLEISSDNVSLRQVVVSSSSYAMLLKKDVKLELYGTNRLTAENGRAIVCRKVAASRMDNMIACKLEISGNVYHCGEITGKEMLSILVGDYIPISEAEFSKYIKGTFIVYFDANGGTCSVQQQIVTPGTAIGALPEPERDYYTFEGWYTAADGGTRITQDSELADAVDTTLYAHWTLNGISDWVLRSQVPEGSQIINQKWTYDERTNTTSREPSLSGYTQYGSYWVQSSNSTFNYASFPDGYDTSNWIYKDFHKSCDVSAYETETEKREVSTSEAGFVYYKWDYNAPYANNTHRSISHKFRSTGVADNFWYGYFHANLSTKNHPYLDNSYCNNANMPSYNCSSEFNTSATAGPTPRFFRFKYYQASYNDYYKVFKYYKLESKESLSAVTETDLISNVQNWVQYRPRVNDPWAP